MTIKKDLKIIKDKKSANTVELEIGGEGHTLANLITEKLLEDERCSFSAYKVPHPLEEKVLIKVTSIKGCDVMNLIVETLRKLSGEIDDYIGKFQTTI